MKEAEKLFIPLAEQSHMNTQKSRYHLEAMQRYLSSPMEIDGVLDIYI